MKPVDTAIFQQVTEKNAALESVNQLGGTHYTTAGKQTTEETGQEKATVPGESGSQVAGQMADKKGLSLIQVLLIAGGAIALFYLALKNKWIKV